MKSFRKASPKISLMSPPGSPLKGLSEDQPKTTVPGSKSIVEVAME